MGFFSKGCSCLGLVKKAYPIASLTADTTDIYHQHIHTYVSNDGGLLTVNDDLTFVVAKVTPNPIGMT
jgi:hypothetical protein